MRTQAHRTTLLLLILALAACQRRVTDTYRSGLQDDGQTMCTEQANASINVVVALPLAQVVGLRIDVQHREGGQVETSILSSADYYDSDGTASIGAFYEQQGTFDVILRRGATILKTFSGVTVTADECHVNGVVLHYP